MEAASDQSEAKKHKVFIVDDHVIVREGLALLINAENDLEVCGEAGDVINALQSIKDTVPDIVIVDLTLAYGSGIRLIENLLCWRPDILILVLTMHDEFVYAERCFKAGARGYIMKKEPSGKVISAIRRLLQGELYISSKLGTRLFDKMILNKGEIAGSVIERLSNRELEVYQLIGQGLKKKMIAEKMNLSVKTVENHMEHIKKKLKLKDLHEIILHAVRNSELHKVNQ